MTAAPGRGPSPKGASLGAAVLLIIFFRDFAAAQEHGQRYVPRSPAATSSLPNWGSPVDPISGLNDTPSVCALGAYLVSGERCMCLQSHCRICEHFNNGVQQCSHCSTGYLLEKGTCLPTRWLYSRSRRREDYDGDSAFYTLFKFLFLFLVMLPCLVLYALRNMHRRHRAGPSEISMYSMPPLLVASAGTDRHHRAVDSQEAGAEESESAALLAPGGDRAKPSNAVLVVGPMGSIEVGVEQEGEERADGEGHCETMGVADEQSVPGRSGPMPSRVS